MHARTISQATRTGQVTIMKFTAVAKTERGSSPSQSRRGPPLSSGEDPLNAAMHFLEK